VSTAPAGLSAEPLSPPAPSAFDATTPAAAAPAAGPAAPPAASAPAPGDAAPPAGLAAVGQRVAVWCPGDGSFYRCACYTVSDSRNLDSAGGFSWWLAGDYPVTTPSQQCLLAEAMP